jgi:phosphate:Na+ symporter
MYIVSHVFLTLGGITLFLLGLKMMSESMEKFSGNGLKTLLANFTKNKYIGVLTGAFSTAVLQSSIATNVILVGFVSNGILSFYQASAVIMGTNIGTTVTAQLVSLSGENSFDITAIAGLVAFIGFLLTLCSSKKVNGIGGVMVGFGTLFLGLKIVNNGVVFFSTTPSFYEIIPPPTTTSPSYSTTDCPRVNARCGSSNSTCMVSSPVWNTVAGASILP